jgi:beta-1,4-mannosyl-glycoprotein beta-1,4-N-acetylglucosaminyltransferase
MKIIDTFIFFNELTLLELRLNILNDYVDEFVLVEATRSHQNKPKPLFYKENKHLFEKFNHKIKHIIVDKFPEHSYWSHETYQRDYIGKCLSEYSDEDIVFISDLDEIWNPKALLPILKDLDNNSIYRWQSLTCYFYLNLIAWPHNWVQPMFMKYSLLDRLQKNGYNISVDILRGQTQSNKPQINNIITDGLMGWHFSYIEDPIYKLQNFLHSEYSNMTIEEIQDCIANGINPFHKHCQMRSVPTHKLEQFLPEYVMQNIDKYKSKIIFKD